MGDPRLEEEIRFGRLMVAQGLAGAEQVQECVTRLVELAALGVSPLPKMGELLVQKGYVTRGQIERTLHGADSAGVPSNPSSRGEIPEEARGETVGKFVKARRLGEGGMGEVWKAWDTELRRWVALKFLKGQDADDIARFRREAQTAARLQHPHIAAVYEATNDFIAMQLIDGKTLEEAPCHDRRLTVEIVRQAALAVHFAHEAGVVHRDLKPANIMVEISTAPAGPEDSESRRLKAVYVMDFGLAKATSVDSGLSISGTILGTPSFMSPEQARGELKAVGPRSDIYSLGATFYFSLTDRAPFEGDQVYDLVKRVIEDDPRSVRSWRPEVDRDLETIAMKCLEKDPARRYPTALALAEDLERWLAGEPLSAHPPSTFYRLRKRLAKRKSLVLVGAAGLLLSGIVAGIAVPKWMAAVRERQNEARGRAQKQKELEFERVAAKRREEALKSLAVLGTTIIERKRDLRQLKSAPGTLLKELEEAVRLVDAYVADWPEAPEGYYVRARGSLYLGDLSGAERDLQTAVAGHPDFRPGWSLLGIVKMHQFEEARVQDSLERQAPREDLERLSRESVGAFRRGWAPGQERQESERWGLAWTREDEIFQHTAEAMYRVFVKSEEESTYAYLEREFQNYRAEEYAYYLAGLNIKEKKVYWLTEALTAAPGYAEAHQARGMEYEKSRDWAAAIAEFGKAIELRKDYMTARMNRGACLAETGDPARAVADYDEVLRINPRERAAYVNRGNARRQLKDYSGALADYRRALELRSDDSMLWAGLGSLKSEMGDLDGAIADLTRAIELKPGDAQSHCLRGWCRSEKGDPDGAIADFTEAVRLDPKLVDGYFNRGVMLHRKGDWEGAIRDYSRALELRPDYRDAVANRGKAKASSGDLEGAIADLSRAIELRRDDADSYYCRGNARTRAGDLDGAIEDYSSAIRIRKDFADAWANRGYARSRKEDREGARADYAQALKVAPPDWAGRAQAEQALKALTDKP